MGTLDRHVSITRRAVKKYHTSYFCTIFMWKNSLFHGAETDSCLLSSSKLSQRIICITVVPSNTRFQIRSLPTWLCTLTNHCCCPQICPSWPAELLSDWWAMGTQGQACSQQVMVLHRKSHTSLIIAALHSLLTWPVKTGRQIKDLAVVGTVDEGPLTGWSD